MPAFDSPKNTPSDTVEPLQDPVRFFSATSQQHRRQNVNEITHPLYRTTSPSNVLHLSETYNIAVSRTRFVLTYIITE